MINKFIKAVCDILELKDIEVSHDTSIFLTPTTLAGCNPNESTIYIKDIEANPDLLYSIAHELRHMWQYRNNKDFYFANYKTSNLIGIEAYNNQIAEVDANAFASVVMINTFGLMPLYHGLTNGNIERIKKRMEEIGEL